MNKGRRNEVRDLKWKRRLKIFGLGKEAWGFRDQGKPCSCSACSPRKILPKRMRFSDQRKQQP